MKTTVRTILRKTGWGLALILLLIGTASAQNSYPSTGTVVVYDRGDYCCAAFQLSDNGFSTHLYSYGNGNFQIHKYGDASSANGPVFNISNNGNVGVTPYAPYYKFEIQGSSLRHTLAMFGDGDSVGYAGIKIGALTTTNISPYRTSQFNLSMRKDSWYGGDGSGPSFIIETTSTNYGYAAPFMITPTNDVILNGGTGAWRLSYGNVGIGTTGPQAKLHIEGPGGGTPELLRINNGYFHLKDRGDGYASQFRMTAGNSVWDIYNQASNGAFHIYQLTNAANGGVYADRLIIDQTGRVGIGNPAPSYKLDVAGQIRSSSGGFMFPDGSVQTTAASSGGVVSVFGRTGTVVAATNDYTWAQINKGTSNLGDLQTRSASDLNAGTLPNAVFPSTLPAVSGANLTGLNASSLGSGTVAPARLGSGTADATTFLRGDNIWAVPSSAWSNGSNSISYTGGNVGIGISAPTQKLEVTGNIKVTGDISLTATINAKYQDVAEWVPSSERVSPGTVVVLDTNKPTEVIASTTSYDTRVAGVVSEQPGIALGEQSDSKLLVATTGRVMVRVDASTAPIHVGDLLVTSDVPGVAMKSQPINLGGRMMHMPGTLIGKALQPLEKGSGKILVLLSLQ